MNNQQTLRLLQDLWVDLHTPDFLWQVLALVLSLVIAFVVARWWRKREYDKAGRLHAAGMRVAFPLLALGLISVVHEVLAASMSVHLLAVAIPLFASLAMVRASVYIMRQSFPGGLWLATSERWIAGLIWLGLALHITGLTPSVIALLDGFALTVGKNPITLWTALKGVLTVIVTVMIALWFSGVIENRLMRLATIDPSLRMVGVRVSKAVLTVLALMAGMSLVGIDMTALSVFTGALGVGLGFGLQKIASNYVSGFILLLDRSIRIGDTVHLNTEMGGVVTAITTRYTVLRTLSGREYIVPNETLISSTVQSQSYSDNYVRVAVKVGVAYGTKDLPAVLKLLESVAAEQPRVLADPPPRALLQEFGDSSINIELGFWIADPQEGTGLLRSDVHLAIWKAFREQGIEIPFPQREVRMLNA